MKFFVLFFSVLFSSIALAQAATTDVVAPNMLQEWGSLASQVFVGLMILATVVAKIIDKFAPGKINMQSLDGTIGKVLKFLFWLPFFGSDPRIKALQVALEEARKNLPKQEEKK